MKIERNTVALFHYRLKDADGTELENSKDNDPVAYLHGRNVMVPGLEAELEAKQAGESLSITLKEPYGPYRNESVQRVPIKYLATKKKPQVGKPTRVNSNSGPREVMVVKVGRFNIDVDTNHPFAGKILTYDIDIVEVRAATGEELQHGHAHGPGGHSH